MNPLTYDQLNLSVSQVSPSTVHCHNTALANYYAYRNLEMIFSQFEFTLPESWDLDYFRLCLFLFGHLAVFDTARYGVVPQHGRPWGFNLFYQPTHYLVANPLLPDLKQLKIGEDCEVIKLRPVWRGVNDLICLYGDIKALTLETGGVNLINSKLSFVFAASNKAAAESYKKLYDQIQAGNPATVIDKNLMNDDGSPAWLPFSQNVKQQFIGNDILTMMQGIDSMFLNEIGVNSVGYEKKERLITDEVDANNEASEALVSVWLKELTASFKRVNTKYGTNLTVRLKAPKTGGKEGKNGNSDNNDGGAV